MELEHTHTVSSTFALALCALYGEQGNNKVTPLLGKQFRQEKVWKLCSALSEGIAHLRETVQLEA